MAYITGTVASLDELFPIVHKALLANGWVVYDDDVNSLDVTANTLVSKGVLTYEASGSGGKKPLVGLRYMMNGARIHGVILVESYIDYDKKTKTASQKSPFYYTVGFSWGIPIDYNIAVNDRRIIFNGTQGSFVQDFYAGFILPLAHPVNYPYPMLITGSQSYKTSNNVDWSLHSSLNSDYNGCFIANQFNKGAGSSSNKSNYCIVDESGSWLAGTSEISSSGQWAYTSSGLVYNGFSVINARRAYSGSYDLTLTSVNCEVSFHNLDYHVLRRIYCLKNNKPNMYLSTMGSLDGVYLATSPTPHGKIIEIDGQKYKLLNYTNQQNLSYALEMK